MKKSIIGLTTVITVVLISSMAYARNDSGMNHTIVKTADEQGFYDNTVAIRAAITADCAELTAVLSKDKRDETKIKTLTQDIVKQKDELRKQAEKFNVRGLGMMTQCMSDNGYNGHCTKIN